MNGHDLVRQLFVPTERWGWQYVEPAASTPRPFTEKRPIWVEPDEPDFERWERRRTQARRRLPTRLMTLVIVAGLVFVTARLPGEIPNSLEKYRWWGVAFVALGVVLSAATVLLPSWRVRRIRRAAVHKRRKQVIKFQAADQRWQARMRAHEENEERRRGSPRRWVPLRLAGGKHRVDVFGGTPDGWASLITTLSSSLLSGGNSVLVLDFTEHQIARELAAFATAGGLPVCELDIPAQVPPSTLLTGFTNETRVELLTDTVRPRRTDTDAVDRRTIVAGLLSTVMDVLDEPPTFTRLLAGLRALRGVSADEDDVLTPDELHRLTARLDTTGQTNRERDELSLLTESLRLLALDDAQPTAEPPSLWPHDGLTVVTTGTSHKRKKEILDRLTIHHLVEVLRMGHQHADDDVIVVAGADHLGLDGIEAIADQTFKMGVRLVLLMSHLDEDVEQHLLGTSGSTAIMMRLGNAKEAARAAEFVGRGHHFMISQITRQIGRTFTEAVSEGHGAREGSSNSTGASRSTSTSRSYQDRGHPSGYGAEDRRSTEASTSMTRAQTWQSTASRSAAGSETVGFVDSRTYEFVVEPTELQALPTTAYIVVEVRPSGRVVVMGDCNPGIALIERGAGSGTALPVLPASS